MTKPYASYDEPLYEMHEQLAGSFAEDSPGLFLPPAKNSSAGYFFLNGLFDTGKGIRLLSIVEGVRKSAKY